MAIGIEASDASVLEANLRAAIGAPYDEGASPQFVSSTSYAWWHHEDLDIRLEDFAPGASRSITRRRHA